MQVPSVEIAGLARGTVAGVIVEAVHLDGAGRGIAVDDELHDSRGLLKIGVARVFGGREDAARADDVRIEIRIDGRRDCCSVSDT